MLSLRRRAGKGVYISCEVGYEKRKRHATQQDDVQDYVFHIDLYPLTYLQ